jgi:hypothetical protein
VTYVPFNPHRRLAEYVGQAAPQGGMLLPPDGYEAIATAKETGLPCQYVVTGEDRDGDRIYLRLAVTRDWIEAVTNYRGDAQGHLRWTCPECGRVGGKHFRACGYEL